MENPEQATVTFSRKSFILIALLGVLIVGLAIGYLIRDLTAPTQVSDAAVQTARAQILEGLPDSSVLNTSGDSAEAVAAPAATATLTVAEQIESLPRHEIAFDEQDPANGPEDAPILIVEFSDFECPYCQRHFQQVYPQLESVYGDQIRYVFLDFPLTSIHPNAYDAAEAALCAFEQDAFWPYHDLLFGASLDLGRETYEAYAADLGLDAAAFSACLDEDRYADQIDADQQEAFSIGVSSTPTFFINGIGLVGAQPFEVFSQIIDYELERLAAE